MVTEVVMFEEVCGNSSIKKAFWNPDVTINTDNPDLTECFQDTALVWGACGFLWLGALIYLPFLSSRVSVNSSHSTSPLNLAKTICCVLIVNVLVADMIYMEWNGNEYNPSRWLVPVIYIATLVLASVIARLEFVKGENSSGLMFCFWLVMLLVNSIKLRTISVLLIKGSYDKVSGINFIIFYLLVLLGFILHIFPDNRALDILDEDTDISGQNGTHKVKCPLKYASFLERVLFTWCLRVLLLGYKKKLSPGKISNLSHIQRTETNVKELHRNWIHAHQGKRATAEEKNDASYKQAVQNPSWQTQSSFLVTLIRTHGFQFFYASIFEFLTIALVYTRPVIMNALLQFVASEDEYAWKGYFLASTLFVVTSLKTFVNQHYIFSRLCLRHRLKLSIYGATYRKCLLLSSSARSNYSVGEIANLIAVDAQKIVDGIVALQDIWSAPVQASVSMWLLYNYLGPSSLAGLTSLLLLITSNYFLMAEIKPMHMTIMKLKDARTKLINEVLNGIKVIKLYAWELPFQGKISAIRIKEIKMIEKMSHYLTFSSVVFSCAPILFTVVTFTFFIWTSDSATLTAQVAFVTLTIVKSMSPALALFPSGIATVVQAMISVRRFERFLHQQELDTEAVNTVTKSNALSA